jgi:hypothetical protein
MPRFSLPGVLVTAAVGVFLGVIGASSSVAAPAGHLVQPRGAGFAVAFPKPVYRVDNDGLHVREQFPGALSAAGYYETPATFDILDPATPIPRAPTYLVMTAVFPSPETAEHFVNLMGKAPGMKPVLVGNVAGYHTLARERSAINKGSHLTQPHAFESLLSVSQGNTVYEAFAITSTAAAARAFTRSLQLTAGSATGLSTLPGSASAPLGDTKSHSAAYKDGEYVGAGLVVLLVLGVVFSHARRPRRSGGSRSAASQYGPPGVGDPSSQFSWMYEGASAPVETPAAPPPFDPSQYGPPTT